MNSLSLLLLLSPLTGILLVRLVWPDVDREKKPALLAVQMFFGSGLGVGLSSVLFFLWAQAPNLPLSYFRPVEIVLFLGCVAAWLVRRKRNRSGRMVAAKGDWLFLVLFSSLILIGAMLFRFSQQVHPGGWWDSWAIWNLRARFIFREGTLFHNAFAAPLAWSALDHPLLLPLTVARSWFLLGGESATVPPLYAAMFTECTLGLAVSALWLREGRMPAMLIGLALVASPDFTKIGAYQIADMPFAFFFLAAVALLCLAETGSDAVSRPTLLAGAALGLAAWTKNEGIPLFFIVLIWRVLHHRRRLDRRSLCTEMKTLLWGASPAVIALVLFKLRMAPENDIVNSDLFSALAPRLADPLRWIKVTKLFFANLARIGWSAATWPSLLVVAVLFGLKRKKAEPLKALIVPAAMLLVYFGIYLLTSHDVAWQIDVSIDRLLLHLWPTLLFLYFCLVHNPLKKEPPAP